MTRWIDNSIADRLYILDHVSSLKDITPESVEKDWWVTAVLQCVFELTAAPYMYFKGGTSLSKGWRLIDRFSEDIDIALYRDFFLNELHRSCAACETNNQIMNLRKVSRDYVTTVLRTELEERLKANGLTGTSIEAVTTRQTSEGEKPIDHDSLQEYPQPGRQIHPSRGQDRNQLPLPERTLSDTAHPHHHIRTFPRRRYPDRLGHPDRHTRADLP